MRLGVLGMRQQVVGAWPDVSSTFWIISPEGGPAPRSSRGSDFQRFGPVFRVRQCSGSESEMRVYEVIEPLLSDVS
jgi:hypothetical protein